MIRILVRVGVLAGAFLLLLAVVRVVGATTKHPMAGLFAEAELPDGQILTCWHGICPGQTTVDEATRILQTDPMLRTPTPNIFPLCWESHAPYYEVCLNAKDNLLNSITFDSSGKYTDKNLSSIGRLTFRLGDLITLWGHPVKFSGPFCGSSYLSFDNNRDAYVTWIGPSQNQNGWQLSPDLAQVDQFTLNAPLSGIDNPNIPLWQGFVTRLFMPCGE